MLSALAHSPRTALAAGLAVGAALTVSPITTSPASAASLVPDFITSCEFSHRAAVDPIVVPGTTDMTHTHDFFGNSGTDENSTPASLRSTGRSTCTATKDKTGYWAPTLSLNGSDLMPVRLRAYYRAGTKSPASIKTLPAGLIMIAGDSKATRSQSTSVVSWGCGQGSRGTAGVPTCSSATLVLHVYFPDCWDGRNLDSADHKSHMAYTHNGACPASHPVPVPKVTEDVQYPTRGGSGVSYSFSGNALGAHADFMHGWTQTTLNTLVSRCLVGRVACGVITD